VCRKLRWRESKHLRGPPQGNAVRLLAEHNRFATVAARAHRGYRDRSPAGSMYVATR
jgi:hypothetical protein